jgi:hypothetical protein
MRQWIRWSLVSVLGVLGACSSGTPSGGNANAVTPPAPSPQSISGTYVAFGATSATDQLFVEALRLTQSAPGQFTGTLESTTLTKTGKGKSTTQNVTGSYDGEHVTLSFDQGIGHVNRTATWAPGSITMSWMQDNGQLGTERFTAKTDAEYASMLQTVGTEREQLVANTEGAQRAQEADKQTAQLVDDLRRFLDKEATWDVGKADQRHKRSIAYGDQGIAKIKQLLASRQSLAEVTASNVSVSMNTTGIQLGLALDSDLNAVAATQKKMAGFDRAIEQSPCLAPDGTLVPNPLPACAPLPDLVKRYRSVHGSAEAILAQINSIDGATRSDYEERNKEAARLVSVQR